MNVEVCPPTDFQGQTSKPNDVIARLFTVRLSCECYSSSAKDQQNEETGAR